MGIREGIRCYFTIDHPWIIRPPSTIISSKNKSSYCSSCTCFDPPKTYSCRITNGQYSILFSSLDSEKHIDFAATSPYTKKVKGRVAKKKAMSSAGGDGDDDE